jgi:hypothetical protein
VTTKENLEKLGKIFSMHPAEVLLRIILNPININAAAEEYFSKRHRKRNKKVK